MRSLSKRRKCGGWAVDGIEYPSLRAASEAIGMPEATIRSRCKQIGRRRVTSSELDQYGRSSGNDEWRALSMTGNTGSGRKTGTCSRGEQL